MDPFKQWHLRQQSETALIMCQLIKYGYIKLNVYGVTKAPCPQGKSQVFTIAESQLNYSDYPGEGELGKAERIGAFPGRKKGGFCD